jgi:alanine racemase
MQSATRLTINLSALQHNWLWLQAQLPQGSRCAGVVKANAYGLGFEKCALALHKVGCRTFCVATGQEGIALRSALPQDDVRIVVMGGFFAGESRVFRAHNLTPALNTPLQAEEWASENIRTEIIAESFLQLDTGMGRLGFAEEDIDWLHHHWQKDSFKKFGIRTFMSHLACADTPHHPQNASQLAYFQWFMESFPGHQGSLANSAGLFLGAPYHFDLARPGIALYGGNPFDAGTAEFNAVAAQQRQVVTAETRIISIQTLTRNKGIGYGATYRGQKGQRLATIAAGYADGLLRSLSDTGCVDIHGYAAPIIGRVSMDLITVDISHIPTERVQEGDQVILIGGKASLMQQAAAASTISYELLTALGNRYKRTYVTDDML